MLSKWIFPDFWYVTVIALSGTLHQRSAWRLSILFTAMLFTKGRKPLQAGFEQQALIVVTKPTIPLSVLWPPKLKISRPHCLR
ncbi:MAG TPA: hypothetical protein PLP49_00900 [Anaerohalosphaeraceae bacterium]|nr:hypothetical protein [Anaerohalosphaeraceae bacterium]HPB93114.1 hypothetical protein [Anaerohalosphaeraceae bacterium]HRT23455.1 hypothetical protein [Anaerohalosphaeraceae bacterium]